MAISSDKMIKDLSEIELTSSTALHNFNLKVRDLCRNLSWTLDFQADMLEAGLRTLPVADAKFGSLSRYVRAKAVAWCLRSAADAVQHAGRNSVKCYSLFLKYYAPHILAARKRDRGTFKIDSDT